MTRLIDLTGDRFGKLVVLNRHGVDVTRKTTWLCRCDCGSAAIVTGLNLKSGNTKSCGCLNRRPRVQDLSGQRFGRLVVLGLHGIVNHVSSWRCLCDCGNDKVVTTGRLKSEHTRSCGCLMSEVAAENARKYLGGAGASHPRWRADLTDEDRLRRRRTSGQRKWSRAIMRRDRFCCVVCHARGKLNAHHIVGYAEFPEHRYSMGNGVTLCLKCHKKFHSANGHLGLTEELFYRFFDLPYPGILQDLRPPVDNPNIMLALKCISDSEKDEHSIEELEKSLTYIGLEIARRTAAHES